jgi:DNA topoisomerase-1
MPLIVIESPNKIATLKKLSKMNVIATCGHFKDLPNSSLGVDLNQNYQPTFEYSKDSLAMVAKLRKAAVNQEVYIATDPDREGFAIGQFVYDEIKDIAKNCYRLEMHEITQAGLTAAMKKVVKFEDSNLTKFDAFLGRRISDRLVGFIMSQIANREIDRTERVTVSVGRVQSPAVDIITSREDEITSFEPEKYWTLDVELQKDKKFSAKHANGRFTEKTEAETAAKNIQEAKTAKVESIKAEDGKQRPRPPFTTVDFQAAASAQLKMSPSQAMRAAQSLFEAGLITYIRTDSVRLSGGFIHRLRSFIDTSYGNAYIPEKPVYYRSKNSQADAHEGIRPTSIHSLADCGKRVFGARLKSQHAKVYELICKRTFASQMTPAEYKKTTIRLTCNSEPLLAEGKVTTFDGFTKLWKDSAEEKIINQVEDDSKLGQLPNLKANDSVNKLSESLVAKQTEPPIRYTEAMLVKKLESLGIGRPSTYASICKTLINKQYAELQKRQLVPTEIGHKLTQYLRKTHPWIVDYSLTREMESKLDQVEDGETSVTWQSVVKDIHSNMKYADPSNKASLPISVNMIRYAKSLQEQTALALPDGALENQKELSAYIKEAKAIQSAAYEEELSTRPLSDKQMKILEENASTRVKNAVAKGDYNAGRRFLQKFFKKIEKEQKSSKQNSTYKKGYAKTTPRRVAAKKNSKPRR